MKRPNLLNSELTCPEESESQALLSRLLNSGSTWEKMNSSELNPDDLNMVFAKCGTEYYRSHISIGMSEYLAAKDIKNRMSIKSQNIMIPDMSNLNSGQKKAVGEVLSNNVSVLHGFPGTGKTFCLRTIIDSYINMGLNVCAASFMGSAAKRMQESANVPAMTIHRLLGYKKDKFTYNESNRLDEIDVMIIDESGTMATVLHYCLLRALKPECILVYVGDPRQLPSLEPGRVLSDLIDCVPNSALHEIMRADSTSPIGKAAKALINGEMPVTEENGQGGFYMISTKDEYVINKTYAVNSRMAELHRTKRDNVLTMAPTNALVDKYNEFCMKIDGEFRIPIIFKKNNAALDYFNGDTGYLDGDCVIKEDGSRVPYSAFSMGLGWARTVWKSQGRESQCVSLIMPEKESGRPKWSELYTAITRGKERVCVIGSTQKVKHIAENPNSGLDDRITLLSKFVRKEADIYVR